MRLLHGDALDVLATLPAACVDAVVTDPPYELGFMGKHWDASGIAYRVELWRQVLRVLRPGGHLLAFGGTRTSHRMVCAIEDAGFEVRDSLVWMYGSGFPKSLNVGNGWGTALKPAHEPICLARKPLEGTVASNVQAHGTGVLNVDGCRIGMTDGDRAALHAKASKNPHDSYSDHVFGLGMRTQHAKPPHASGRWPANVLLDAGAAALLDAQSGVLKSGARNGKRKAHDEFGTFCERERDSGNEWGTSAGGASRFFYCAKASRKERGAGNTHPTVKPLALMRWLVRLVTPPGGLVLDPFAGSGTTGLACKAEGFRFLGIEREAQYVEIAEKRMQLSLFGAAA